MRSLTVAELAKVALLRPDLRAVVPELIGQTEDLTGKQVVIPPHGALRSRGVQQALWDDRGNNPYPVAPPGLSYHEVGGAIDLDILNGTDADYQVMHRVATSLGLVHGGKNGTDLVHSRVNESLDVAAAKWQQLQQQRRWWIGASLVVGGGLLVWMTQD